MIGFPPNASIVLYRIIQEALTNVGKHAKARSAAVSIRMDGSRIAFDVQDDGQGFDTPRTLASESALGLAILNERVRMLGGSFQIFSRKGEGTRLSFWIPAQETGQ
jgi:two-component system, NarL family, sensor histidine kinase UhpB